MKSRLLWVCLLTLCAGTALAGVREVRLVPATAASPVFGSATATAPLLDELNRINFPPQFRARLTGAWSGNDGWRARVAINRTGGYTNDLANPIQEVRAYTTVDARLAYDLADRTSSSVLRDLSIAFEVTNLFGANPPFVNIAPSVNGGGGFDPNTVNPIGRLIGLTINKRF